MFKIVCWETDRQRHIRTCKAASSQLFKRENLICLGYVLSFFNFLASLRILSTASRFSRWASSDKFNSWTFMFFLSMASTTIENVQLFCSLMRIYLLKQYGEKIFEICSFVEIFYGTTHSFASSLPNNIEIQFHSAHWLMWIINLQNECIVC